VTLRQLGIKYRMLDAQKRFHASIAKYRAYIGGYGSGKTLACCHEAIRLSVINMGLPGMLVAPTHGMSGDNVAPMLFGILNRAGIEYKYLKSEGRVVLPWGSTILLRSADNPDRLKGPNLAWAGVDEAALIARKAWEVVISRIRHPGAVRHSAFITTTPEGFNWVYEEFVEKRRRGYTVIQASTEENVHLPPGYVRDLEDAYDQLTARQYLHGEFVNTATGRVYHAFDRRIHISPDTALENRSPLLLAIDFNVDPLCAAACQISDGTVRVFDEFVLGSSGTYGLCEAVEERYPGVHVIAYPDASGRARKTAGAPEAPSDFAILMNHGFEVRARRRNPRVRDRVNAVNKKLSGGEDGPGVLVSPGCRETIRSFEQTAYRPNSREVDKSRGVEHMSDAIGYLIEYEFPVNVPARVDYKPVSRSGTNRGY